jgi:hypothetical protein
MQQLLIATDSRGRKWKNCTTPKNISITQIVIPGASIQTLKVEINKHLKMIPFDQYCFICWD